MQIIWAKGTNDEMGYHGTNKGILEIDFNTSIWLIILHYLEFYNFIFINTIVKL